MMMMKPPIRAHQSAEQTTSEHPNYTIIDVWRSNLLESFAIIQELVKSRNFVAMDTEFPGVVARPLGNFSNMAEYHYQALKVNVDMLKVIQLGLTFFDEKGTVDPKHTTFQFNFAFNRSVDMSASDSMKLLDQAGIDFDRHESEGIDPFAFAELMISSGVVLEENVTFLSFHSGYDFGYLQKVLANRMLPETEREFFEMVKILFPNIYDVKYLIRSCKNLKGGLEEIAKQLDIHRYGPSHQAGSDSLLTGLVFFKIREQFFDDHIDEIRYSGHLFGLGICSVYAPPTTAEIFPNVQAQQPLDSSINPAATAQMVSGANFAGVYEVHQQENQQQQRGAYRQQQQYQPEPPPFMAPEMERHLVYDGRIAAAHRHPQPIPIVSGVTGERVVFPGFLAAYERPQQYDTIADRSNQQHRDDDNEENMGA